MAVALILREDGLVHQIDFTSKLYLEVDGENAGLTGHSKYCPSIETSAACPDEVAGAAPVAEGK